VISSSVITFQFKGANERAAFVSKQGSPPGLKTLVRAHRAGFHFRLSARDNQATVIPIQTGGGRQRRPANRVEKITGTQPHPGLRTLHLALWTGFIFCAAGWFTLLTCHPLPGNGGWVEGFFLILAAGMTLAGLARRLPAQNVVAAAALIAVMSSMMEMLSAKAGVPFGHMTYSDNIGPKFFGLLPWPIPLIWIVVVLNARDVARRILRPWRKLENYGLWVMGLACALAVGFDLGFEPFAVVVRRYWTWTAVAGGPVWYGVPWTNFLGRAAGTLLVLVVITPWLINKSPVEQAPDDHPLAMWLFLNLFFAAQNAAHQLWLATSPGLMISILLTIAVFRNRAAIRQNSRA
jgi:uncharacterized membrane protein